MFWQTVYAVVKYSRKIFGIQHMLFPFDYFHVYSYGSVPRIFILHLFSNAFQDAEDQMWQIIGGPIVRIMTWKLYAEAYFRLQWPWKHLQNLYYRNYTPIKVHYGITYNLFLNVKSIQNLLLYPNSREFSSI